MDDSSALMHVDWIRWLEELKKAVERPITLTTNQITMGSGRLLGRTSVGTGAAEQITVAGSLTLSGGVLTGTGSTVTPSALTKTDDTNVTLALGGTPATALLQAVSLTLGWTGTLAAARLNANVVQSVVNDTNVTGSIATQALTLGWTGTLAVARGGIGVGTLASNGVLYGNGTGAVQALAVNSTATPKYLSQVSSGAPTWEEVAAAGGTVRGEVPAGAVNGSNTVYTTAADYGDDLAVYRNGIRQKLTTDYTETTPTTFTFGTAPLTGDLLQVDYSEPGGAAAGALVLIEQHTASASATLDFTTAITSTYDEYLIEFVGILPATDNVDLYLRCSTDGGSSYDTGSNYHWSAWLNSPTFSVGLGSASAAFINLAPNVDNGAVGGVSGSLRLFTPLSSSTYKPFSGQIGYLNNDGGRYNLAIAAWYLSTTAVNAVRVLFSSGNIASGTIRVYGVAK